MEFKYRADDHRPPPSSCPFSSSMGFRSFLRAVPNNTDQMPTPNDMEERIRREVEKKEIRRQIFSGELARRKMLEEEVRRELMMEREMDLRRNLREKLSFEERVAMGLNPGHDMNISPPSYGNRLLEEPVASPHSREFDDILTVPQLPQFVAAEIKPALQTNKDKVIMLPKPDPDHYEAKRKAVTPPAIDEHSASGLKKKPQEDWSCTFCQVSVSSWKAFSEHLQGKKHKAKESAMRKPKIGKSATTSFASKKSEKSVNPTETIVIPTSGLDAKADVWSLLGGVNQTVAGEEILETKTDKRLLQKNHETEDSNKQNGSTEEEKAGKTKAGKRKRKFKFWCEACQVGAYSSEVMEGHRRGKKHIKRFKFCQNDGSDPSSGYQVVGKEI